MMRVSNLPTVWTNVFAGWVLGLSISSVHESPLRLAAIFSPQFLYLLIGASSLYVAGMIFNDLWDYEWDRRHRPERPLVTGAVAKLSAQIASMGLLIGGTIFIIFGAIPAVRSYVTILVVLLVGLILIYNRWHKGVAWAPYVMGLCRFMLPLIGCAASGAASVSSPSLILFLHALTLWILTVSVTFLARDEVRVTRHRSLKDKWLYGIPLPLMLILPWNVWTVFFVLGYGLWIWTSNRRHPLPAGVAGRVADRLSAFPFIDALLVSSLWAIRAPSVVMTALGFVAVCWILNLLSRKYIPAS